MRSGDCFKKLTQFRICEDRLTNAFIVSSVLLEITADLHRQRSIGSTVKCEKLIKNSWYWYHSKRKKVSDQSYGNFPRRR